jgi:hypothetical protein
MAASCLGCRSQSRVICGQQCIASACRVATVTARLVSAQCRVGLVMIVPMWSQVTWTDGATGQEVSDEYDTVLLAVGRDPCTPDLNLPSAGVEVDRAPLSSVGSRRNICECAASRAAHRSIG